MNRISITFPGFPSPYLTLNSTGHSSLSIGKTLVPAYDDIRIQKDNTNLLAKLEITSNATHIGAASKAGTFPEPPKPGKGDLELLYQYANSKGVKTGDYDVIDALGKSIKGKLDGNGFNQANSAAGGP